MTSDIENPSFLWSEQQLYKQWLTGSNTVATRITKRFQKWIMIQISRPSSNDAPGWYRYFLDLVPGDDLIAALQNNKKQMTDLICAIPRGFEDFRYAEGKWTLKQVFIHLADEERYYAYKSFCYSRQTNVLLEVPMGPNYTKDFNAGNRTIAEIAEDLRAVREATISLFLTMTEEMLDFKDFPGKETYSARSLGWFAVGHNIHHCNMVMEKYQMKGYLPS